MAWNVTLQLAANGLLCKPTHSSVVRLAPCLTINDQELDRGLEILDKVLR